MTVLRGEVIFSFDNLQADASADSAGGNHVISLDRSYSTTKHSSGGRLGQVYSAVHDKQGVRVFHNVSSHADPVQILPSTSFRAPRTQVEREKAWKSKRAGI